MTELQELPLFPLNTVLFPGMILPLHIFEPRYKQMIGECLKENKPFGVALIREGEEVGDMATPHYVGTSAYITHVEREDDGRMMIQTVGYKRFKIKSLRFDKPYLVGIVEDYPLRGEKRADVQDAMEEMMPDLMSYLEVLTETTGQEFSLDEPPVDGVAMAFLTAIVLPINPQEKQALLAADDLLDLLREEHAMLRREVRVLDMIRRQQQEQPPRIDSDFPFSLN